jgi:probable phosphoglycerate mutase
MKVFLVRHGATDAKGDVSLNEMGRKQAELLAKTLKVDFSRVYCSDLLRSKETAEILNKELGKELIVDDSLREFDEHFLVGEGTETEKKQFEKLEKFVAMLHNKRESDERILIVGHGVLNKIIIAKLFGLTLEQALFLKIYYCSKSVVKWGSKLNKPAWRIESLNCCDHLPKDMIGCIPK